MNNISNNSSLISDQLRGQMIHKLSQFYPNSTHTYSAEAVEREIFDRSRGEKELYLKSCFKVVKTHIQKNTNNCNNTNNKLININQSNNNTAPKPKNFPVSSTNPSIITMSDPMNALHNLTAQAGTSIDPLQQQQQQQQQHISFQQQQYNNLRFTQQPQHQFHQLNTSANPIQRVVTNQILQHPLQNQQFAPIKINLQQQINNNNSISTNNIGSNNNIITSSAGSVGNIVNINPSNVRFITKNANNGQQQINIIDQNHLSNYNMIPTGVMTTSQPQIQHNIHNIQQNSNTQGYITLANAPNSGHLSQQQPQHIILNNNNQTQQHQMLNNVVLTCTTPSNTIVVPSSISNVNNVGNNSCYVNNNKISSGSVNQPNIITQQQQQQQQQQILQQYQFTNHMNSQIRQTNTPLSNPTPPPSVASANNTTPAPATSAPPQTNYPTNPKSTAIPNPLIVSYPTINNPSSVPSSTNKSNKCNFNSPINPIVHNPVANPAISQTTQINTNVQKNPSPSQANPRLNPSPFKVTSNPDPRLNPSPTQVNPIPSPNTVRPQFQQVCNSQEALQVTQELAKIRACYLPALKFCCSPDMKVLDENHLKFFRAICNLLENPHPTSYRKINMKNIAKVTEMCLVAERYMKEARKKMSESQSIIHSSSLGNYFPSALLNYDGMVNPSSTQDPNSTSSSVIPTSTANSNHPTATTLSLDIAFQQELTRLDNWPNDRINRAHNKLQQILIGKRPCKSFKRIDIIRNHVLNEQMLKNIPEKTFNSNKLDILNGLDQKKYLNDMLVANNGNADDNEEDKLSVDGNYCQEEGAHFLNKYFDENGLLLTHLNHSADEEINLPINIMDQLRLFVREFKFQQTDGRPNEFTVHFLNKANLSDVPPIKIRRQADSSSNDNCHNLFEWQLDNNQSTNQIQHNEIVQLEFNKLNRYYYYSMAPLVMILSTYKRAIQQMQT